MKTVKKLLLVTLVIAICFAAFALPSYAINIYKDKTSSYTSFDEVSNNVIATVDDWDNAPKKVYGTFPTRKGVILVTSSASSKGIVGHAAIVYSSKKIIESIGYENANGDTGVVLDDHDWNSESGGIKKFVGVTVKDSTTATDAQVADWCYKQIGKPYNFVFSTTGTDKKFYCSQLIYEAYKKKGINLNTPLYDIHLSPASSGLTCIGPYELIPNGAREDRTFIIYAQNWDGK